ncbi:nuclear transport factor 2 family protein [Sphingomonas sp. MMS24-J13]|uniref:nuclear transport factor 2 family protein n=1 Tax=Sphingomonas sp. MMS24-J13 TaxID=3238686 RepID=UPI003850BE48
MTKDDVRDYIASFNRLDFDGFGKYYADDVKLSLSGKRTLTSRQQILDFYAGVAKVCREKLDITHLVVDDEGVAIEVKTEFKALVDDPDFIAGPLVPGESIFITSRIFYALRDGKFAAIDAMRVGGVATGPSTF